MQPASKRGIPTLNTGAKLLCGRITNKWLGAKSAKKICVAFDGMDKFFPKARIIKTGNPIRKESVDIAW
jgi:UDP-N-acetylglucosamine--N-acetylmuramyl-(pentapeptide) pyrophosphoryl-undecaprenol N-acetylglucosamine transferase